LILPQSYENNLKDIRPLAIFFYLSFILLMLEAEAKKAKYMLTRCFEKKLPILASDSDFFINFAAENKSRHNDKN